MCLFFSFSSERRARGLFPHEKGRREASRRSGSPVPRARRSLCGARPRRPRARRRSSPPSPLFSPVCRRARRAREGERKSKCVSNLFLEENGRKIHTIEQKRLKYDRGLKLAFCVCALFSFSALFDFAEEFVQCEDSIVPCRE